MKKVALHVDLVVPNKWTESEVEVHFRQWLRDLECHYRMKLMDAMADNDSWTNRSCREAAMKIYRGDIDEVKAAILSVRARK